MTNSVLIADSELSLRIRYTFMENPIFLTLICSLKITIFFMVIFSEQINFDKSLTLPYYTRFGFTPCGEKSIKSRGTHDCMDFFAISGHLIKLNAEYKRLMLQFFEIRPLSASRSNTPTFHYSIIPCGLCNPMTIKYITIS
jgi:hypothetical protein